MKEKDATARAKLFPYSWVWIHSAQNGTPLDEINFDTPYYKVLRRESFDTVYFCFLGNQQKIINVAKERINYLYVSHEPMKQIKFVTIKEYRSLFGHESV